MSRIISLPQRGLLLARPTFSQSRPGWAELSQEEACRVGSVKADLVYHVA